MVNWRRYHWPDRRFPQHHNAHQQELDLKGNRPYATLRTGEARCVVYGGSKGGGIHASRMYHLPVLYETTIDRESNGNPFPARELVKKLLFLGSDNTFHRKTSACATLKEESLLSDILRRPTGQSRHCQRSLASSWPRATCVAGNRLQLHQRDAHQPLPVPTTTMKSRSYVLRTCGAIRKVRRR